MLKNHRETKKMEEFFYKFLTSSYVFKLPYFAFLFLKLTMIQVIFP